MHSCHNSSIYEKTRFNEFESTHSRCYQNTFFAANLIEMIAKMFLFCNIHLVQLFFRCILR